MKSSRNVDMTKKYLKDNTLLAVPFDKGIGICNIKKAQYHSKPDAIIDLPQFKEVVSTRKNAKHPVVKEQERVVATLQRLRDDQQRTVCKTQTIGKPTCTFIRTSQGAQDCDSGAASAVHAWFVVLQHRNVRSRLAVGSGRMQNQLVNKTDK